MRAKPVGTKRRSEQGYITIKTAMGQRRWPFEHRVVWESAHGPIPEGSYIHHLNGIRFDNRLDNLCLVPSNGEHHHVFHRGGVKPGVSRALKGRPKSLEHKAKIAEALKGKPKSLEHRANLSKTLKGRPRPDISALFKDKPKTLSPEHREKLRAAAKKHREPQTGQFS